ncbi:MAG: hypothetical protein C4324_08080 [Blastocatellia bacterium]
MRNLRATIRFLALLLATLGFYAAWYLGHFFIPNKIFWRQVIFELWSRAFVRIAGMKLEINGSPPKPPFFLVSNHLGYIDVPVIRSVAKGVFVAKHDIENWFLVGRMIRDMGTVFINRQNRRDIPRAGSEILKRLECGEGVIVFPEGTSTRGEEVLSFNSSFFEFAARAGVSVCCVAISYRTPAEELRPSESICWWDDTPFLNHLFRMLSVRSSTAVLNFCTEAVSATDRKELAARLRERVAELFIPVL